MIKKILLDIEPNNMQLIISSIDVYHDFLHDAQRFDHDIGLTKKEVSRRIIRCHNLERVFEDLKFDV